MRKNISVIASSLILFPKLQNEEVNNNVTVNTATISTKILLTFPLKWHDILHEMQHKYFKPKIHSAIEFPREHDCFFYTNMCCVKKLLYLGIIYCTNRFESKNHSVALKHKISRNMAVFFFYT
jgi:hypothetical protein